jgi:hypothetical protein
MWSVERSGSLAREQLAGLGDRWAHVQAIGRLAEVMLAAGLIGDDVASAAWLHDVGYAPDFAVTGFHPLDGARYLQRLGAPEAVVALVGSHTGARWEASERGLLDEWSKLPTPSDEDLDTLTLIDLVIGPTGQPVEPGTRIEEVLGRYSPADPTHRAVQASREALTRSASRARARLRLSNEWPAIAVQGVLKP